MASVARQPFAPLDGSRLQSLTSIKNRQNALSTPSPKRKAAEELIFDDLENVSPLLFSKRAKGSLTSSPKNAISKPSSYTLAHKPSTSSSLSSCTPAPSTPPRSKQSRAVLKPKSPAARLLASLSKPSAKSTPAPPVPSVPALSSLSTPAGRSPPRAKRSGILSRHRATRHSPYGRVDPPSSDLGSNIAAGNAAPFGLDAALKGTVPSYKPRRAARTKSKSSLFPSPLGGQDMKASWFFDIHEDTPEQEMTNMLQHSTCVLDISSDEECESKATMENGRNKENIPPLDDISQTTTPTRSKTPDEMDLVKERRALCDLNAEDFYAKGCDSRSVFVVPADEEEEEETEEEAEEEESAVETKTADEFMASKPASEAFDLWESGSAHGDD